MEMVQNYPKENTKTCYPTTDRFNKTSQMSKGGETSNEEKIFSSPQPGNTAVGSHSVI